MPDPAGTLLAIGGAEDRLGHRTVLRRFVRAAGGSAARIVVVPTASALGRELFDSYARAFLDLGAERVEEARPGDRRAAGDPALAARVARSTGVFLTGGNQLTLSAAIVGTPFSAAVADVLARGGAVGGTSAGASALSEHMVAFGRGGATPRQRMSQLSAGLGLWPDAVVDQHFEQRNRYGRLLSLVSGSPHLLGVGVDEDTAAVVTRARWLEVVGRGAVTLVDGSALHSTSDRARRGAALLVSGAVLHVLPAGARFDLRERVLVADGTPEPDAQVVALARAEGELRRVLRRGGVPEPVERTEESG